MNTPHLQVLFRLEIKEKKLNKTREHVDYLRSRSFPSTTVTIRNKTQDNNMIGKCSRVLKKLKKAGASTFYIPLFFPSCPNIRLLEDFTKKNKTHRTAVLMRRI